VKYSILVVAVVFAIVVASCNCGGAVVPCASSTDCPTNQTCVGGYCENNGGGGGSGGGDGGGGSNVGGGGSSCTGLECQQVSCPAGTTTTLTGKVYTPAGDLPLYNAIVYVPNGPVQPFPDGGVTCDRCGAAASGNPLVTALTDPSGTFRLENVPAGQNIPLVIQMGKWRRQVTIANVGACQEAALNAGVTRLPRNQSEGDIPKMAIATGDADPFECLLLKLGLDAAEVTASTGTGRVHFYRAQGGTALSTATLASDRLWGSLATLKQYDIVMLPCEGTANTDTPAKTIAGKQNVINYTNAGGRVFATHYSYNWIATAPAPFPSVADWNLSGTDPVNPYQDPFDVTVDTSFPKGSAFADWLMNVQASTTRGTLTLRETRHNVDSVNTPAAQRWLYGDNTREGSSIVPHFTFNTPVSNLAPDAGAPEQCGRVVFSSFHVSANALVGDGGTTFPTACRNDPPSAQEKALIFMLFDLSSCVQRDDIPPIVIN
jgi:hypothetical protein